MGTRINNLPVTRVVDGDTLKILINGKREFLRLDYVDTEESMAEGNKPVTIRGKAASAMALEYFTDAQGELINIDIEFDTDEPIEICLEKSRDHQGRLVAYVWKNDENFNIKLIEEGWSPYFCKYGYSRQYHRQMLQGEVLAQSKNLLIWNPENKLANTPGRNYRLLSNWWCLRASIVEDYRRYGQIHGILSVRDDFPAILEAASKEAYITIFADLQDGIKTWLSSGAIIYDGIRNRQLKLWIPDANSADQKPLIQLLQNRYFGIGRGYAYVTGYMCMYRDKPEMILESLDQISDFANLNNII